MVIGLRRSGRVLHHTTRDEWLATAVAENNGYFDLEPDRAPRALTDNLFHYTSADSAIFGILSSGTLRLSPFEFTNDPWESRPLHPSLSVHADDADFAESIDSFQVWTEIDRHIRQHAKVACLTQDWDLPDSALDPNALRGWSHLSLWAHYGGAHSGLCLQFNRNALIESFGTLARPGIHASYGRVKYVDVSLGSSPGTIDIGLVREFGLDAVALAHAIRNNDAIFFRKHRDWANEAEFRLALLDQSPLPAAVPIKEALTGVFIGDSFATARLPALREVLARYPGVEIHQLRYHNRTLQRVPMDGARPDSSVSAALTPRREGSLVARYVALREAEEDAAEEQLLANAETFTIQSQLWAAISNVAARVAVQESVEVAVHENSSAIPESLRARAPGVSGEQVLLQHGYMCVVENLPKYSHTLVLAIAAQVLAEKMVRVHAVSSMEEWHRDGTRQTELWRDVKECSLPDGSTIVTEVASHLLEATGAALESFNAGRSHG